MRRFNWLIALVALLALITVSCEEPSISPSATQSSTRPPQGSSAQSTAVSEAAFALLAQYLVYPVDSKAMLKAGLENIKGELIAAGIVAPELATPTFTDDASANLRLYRQVADGAIVKYGSKISPSALNYAAIRGFIKAVDDCHTSFLEPKQYSEQIAFLNGKIKFGGIGAVLRKPPDANFIVVVNVFYGGPAEKAGLRAGDRVVAVDGQRAADLTLLQTVNLVRGREGSEVRLTIIRAGSTQQSEMRIVRATINPPATESSVIEDRIGYLRIYGISSPAAEQVDAALKEFSRRNLTGWIIDLRNNGGGSLDAENVILSKLIDKGLLFYVWEKDGQRRDYQADRSIAVEPRPIVVLVNEGTASGAEILAALVQEHRLGGVVGTRTAGCVATGRIFELPDGSAIQITVGRIVTGVRNNTLNGVGVVPDYEVETTVEDLTAGRDPQLAKAVELLRPAAKKAA